MVRPNRFVILSVVVALLGLFVVPPQAVRAQDSGEAKRKVKTQVTPIYPDVARRMNVHGKVKLQLTVAPDGSVKNIQVLGGHPLLASAAQDAVRNWKFEVAPKESTQIVEVNFD